eukprot:117407_1
MLSVLIYYQHKEAGCGKFVTKKRLKLLWYQLRMSSKNKNALNTYEALVTKDLHETASTCKQPAKESYIKCDFGKYVHIDSIEIGPAKIVNRSSGKILGAKFLQGAKLWINAQEKWKRV